MSPSAAAKQDSRPDSAQESQTLPFGADVSRLLGIVANALYTHHDVFLRELISNAADACDRLRYEAIETPSLMAGDSSANIHITKDTAARTLTLSDNGIGMSREELIAHLGSIATSGTAKLLERIAEQGAGDNAPRLIGQFGVGFYASFMVADRVEVFSRRAGSDESWLWDSDGRTGFTIRAAQAEEIARLLPSGRGTAIILHMKDESSDFLFDEKITSVVRRYSDHIGIPVYVGDSPDPANAATALWLRPKKEISAEQYQEFFRHITPGEDTPLLTAHWKAEGAADFSALLFIPTLRPWDLFDPARRHAVKLYVRRVFISDQCDGLVYPWLRFLRGVIDCEGLPLNISRESLQYNPLLEKIRRAVAKRILSDLDRLSTEDPTAFASFCGQFGPVLKEGLYDAVALRPDIFKVVRFRSSHDEGRAQVSLDDYVSRMKDGQTEIYYITGESAESLTRSPQIEGFRARGVEVLFLTDTIDDFWLPVVGDYQGKPFRSVTKGAVDLNRFGPAPSANQNEKGAEAAHSEHKEDTEALAPFLNHLARALDGEIGAVRASQRLTDSPVCLVAAEDEVDLNLERVLKTRQDYKPVSKRVLEINTTHPLIRALATQAPQNPDSAGFMDCAHLLLDQARIVQGEPLSDPAAFARRMADVMKRALGSTAGP